MGVIIIIIIIIMIMIIIIITITIITIIIPSSYLQSRCCSSCVESHHHPGLHYCC